MKSNIPRVATGIEGLDAMMDGGFPKGRLVLVCGGPGTGKTIMATQFLVNGCNKYGENGLFVSLDEPLGKIVEETKYFGWNVEGLIEKGKLAFIEARARKSFLKEFIQNIEDEAASIKAERISIDALTHLNILCPNVIERRNLILKLFDGLNETNATCLLTNEIRAQSERAIMLEEYLADGVIILQSSQVERSMVRTLEIEKMRGTSIDEQIRPYIIDKNGIEVISERDIFTYAAKLLAGKV